MANAADPIAGVAQILSVFVGAATATAVAPHLVVGIAGLAGGVLGLMDWRQCTLREGLSYVGGMASVAWLMSSSVAAVAAVLWPVLDDSRSLAPIALSIGWIGHRWPGVAKWAGRLARRWVEAALTNNRTNQ